MIISAHSEIEFAVSVDVTSVSFCFTWRTTGASIANQTELAPATDDNAMIELAGGQRMTTTIVVCAWICKNTHHNSNTNILYIFGV